MSDRRPLSVLSLSELLFRCWLPFVTAAILCLLAAPARAVVTKLEIVALTGDLAPDGRGPLGGYDIAIGAAFNNPVLNDVGQVAFRARYGGGWGIFRADDAALVQLARSAQVAPAGAGHLDGLRDLVVLNNAGQAAFHAGVINSPLGTNEGIFRGDGATLNQLVRTGDAAPDGNGKFFKLSEIPTLNGAGQAAFKADLTETMSGGADRAGIFRADGNSLIQIARGGQVAPDGDELFLSLSQISLNEIGQVAFRAEFGEVDGSDYRHGIFLGDDTTLIQVVRGGQTAPDGKGKFLSLAPPVLNDSGQVAFLASLSCDCDRVNESGIFRWDSTAIRELAHAGDSVPGGDGRFYQFEYPTMNDSGQVAFFSQLENTSGGIDDNWGLYRSDGTTLVQAVRKGQQVPDGNGRFLAFQPTPPALNSKGQTAFLATLAATAGGESDDQGLYFVDDNLEIQQVARSGEAFLGSIITELGFVSGAFQGDEGSGFANEGLPRIAYRFLLEDGREGIAVWSLVPEPGTFALVGMAIFGVAGLRVRKRVV